MIDIRKFNVLLADDEEPALLGLEKGVNWETLNIDKVYKCHSKDTAIRMLNTYTIDIIITDIEMPNGSGLELIKWVRENKKGIPAIFYTGHAEFSYAQEALRLGAVDYLLKPIPYAELEKIIERIESDLLESEDTEGEIDISEREGEVSQAEIVKQVKHLIAQNLSEGNLQREELASMVHISPGYLGRIFKKETGYALSDYIIEKRISVAKQLLTKTNLSITAVAERVGITYSSYFTKLFKDKVGVTPQEYRQNNK